MATGRSPGMTGPAAVAASPSAARPSARLVWLMAVAVAAVVAAAAAVAGGTSSGGGGGVRLATTARVALPTDAHAAAATAAAPGGPDDAATAAFEAALAEERLAARPPLPVAGLFTRQPGYFTLHVGRGLAAGRVLVEVPAATLGVPFIVTSRTVAGDAEAHHAGLQEHPWYFPNVFAFREAASAAGAALDLYRPLMALRRTEGRGGNASAAAEPVRDGYFPGWLHTFPTRPGSAAGSYLLDAAPWVEAGFFIITDDDGRLEGKWEKEHRLVDGAAYPQNVELDVQVRTRSVSSLGTSVLSPENYFARVTRYSIIALPETPMEPRVADVRVGYYGQTFVSADAADGGRLKRTYINRWDLTKRKHITYHVDPSVPPSWRQTVKEGVEAWNRAFVAAGHAPTTVRALLPGDPDWPADYAAADSRYSSITWPSTVAPTAAYGPSVWDPRSGEIFNANAVVPATWVNSYAQGADIYVGGSDTAAAAANRSRHELYAPPTETQMMAEGVALVRALRSADAAAAAALTGAANGSASAGAPSTVDDAVATYVRQAMKWLVMHEIGHTMGLMHNFRGSAAVPFAKLSDAAYVAANGLYGSVMDYVPPLVRLNAADHSFYFSPTVGTYDVEAIRYGYGTFQSDAERVAVAQAVARDAAFATDHDGPGLDGCDPLTSYQDLSATPLDYYEEVLAVARRTLDAGLAATARTAGASWVDFGGDAASILSRAVRSVAYVTKFIGGAVPSRASSGGGAAAVAAPPVTWVEPATQERALRLITRELSPYGDGLLGAAATARLGPYLVRRVCGGGGGPTDQCLGVAAQRVTVRWWWARGIILGALLTPARLASMADARVAAAGGDGSGGGGWPSVSAVLSRVTATFFDGPVNGGGGGGGGVDAATAGLARDAQAQWVDQLLYVAAARGGGGDGHAADAAVHPAAAAAVVAELAAIHAATAGGAGTPGGGGGGDEAAAHRAGLAALTAAYAAPAAAA